MILHANDKSRRVEVSVNGHDMPSISAEQAIKEFNAGNVKDLSAKTLRLIAQFEGDWNALAKFYAECDI